jgi:mono/diheme cytochrome c family protein
MDLMYSSRRRVFGSLVAVAGLVLVAGSVFAGAARAPVTATGEEVYASQKCSVCHSVDGKGNKKYPLDGVGSRLSEEDIREWLLNPDAQQAKKGARPLMRMPSYRSLPPEDVDALVGYVKSLK